MNRFPTAAPAVGALLFALVVSPPPARADIEILPRQGRSADATLAPEGPGVVVMGGNFDVDAAFVWMHETVSGKGATQGGDVVVLRDPDPRAGHDDDYTAYLLKLAPFNSVQTVVLSGTVSASDAAQAVALIDHAEAVFFGGGDQRDYVGWKGPVLDAVQRVYDRKGVVGGTSAGSALWGAHVNDAIGEYHYGSTLSADALADPYDPSITFTHHLFNVPALSRVITDSHFEVRDRFGRLAVYTARLVADGSVTDHALGVGVDEDSALVMDANGRATLMQYTPGQGGAWIVRGAAATTIAHGAPLVDSVQVMRLDANGAWFDFARECGSGAGYAVAIDARNATPFAPANPYTGSGSLLSCAALPPDAGVPTGAADGGGGGGGDRRDAGPSTPPSSGPDAGAPSPPSGRDGGGASSGDDGDPGTPLVPAASSGCACTSAPHAGTAASPASTFASVLALVVVGAVRRRPGAVRNAARKAHGSAHHAARFRTRG